MYVCYNAFIIILVIAYNTSVYCTYFKVYVSCILAVCDESGGISYYVFLCGGVVIIFFAKNVSDCCDSILGV